MSWITSHKPYHAAGSLSRRASYRDGDSIDWMYEHEKERARLTALSRLELLLDWGKTWVAILGTGLCVGLLAAYLDVVSAFLSDARLGICVEDFWLDQNSCCTGLDPGEACRAWATWDAFFGFKMTAFKAIASYLSYIILGVIFATASALLVRDYAPQAFHSGLPEIKAILGGYIIKGYLDRWTLAIKALGLVTAVASGLSLGKEGPLVHVACCVGNQVSNLFAVFRDNEARKRQLLSAAAAAGLSVAFGAPLGSVAFSLEEASSYFSMQVLWQTFVCAIVAAITLQYINVSGTGRLALFEVTASQVYRGFEIFPFILIGIAGGVIGHYLIKFNIGIARARKQSSLLQNNPVTEVALMALVTAITSYIIPYMRVSTNKLVGALFQGCSTASDPLGLCESVDILAALTKPDLVSHSHDRVFTTAFFLFLTAAFKFLETALVFGMALPAGVFLPSTAIGAAFGRAVGLVMNALTNRYAKSAMFASCPVDAPCISASIYAVAGAAATLTGVTRMTLSIVCIFFELTGAVDLVLTIMLAVMASKFTGDFLARDGIYEAWISFRDLPFLNPKVEYRNLTGTAEDVLTEGLAVIPRCDATLADLEALLGTTDYKGFPVVSNAQDMILLGYITRSQLAAALLQARSTDGVHGSTLCRLLPDALDHSQTAFVELQDWVEVTPMTLPKKTNLEVVVQLFQRLGLRYLLLLDQGRLCGILTKHDVHYLQSDSSPSTRADMQAGIRGQDGPM